MVPSETLDNALLQGGMFLFRSLEFVLVLLNFENLELNKKILQRILLSSVAFMHTRILLLGAVWLNLPEAIGAVGQTLNIEKTVNLVEDLFCARSSSMQ